MVVATSRQFEKGSVMTSVWLVQNSMFDNEFGYDQFVSAIDAAGQRRIEIPYCFWDYSVDIKLNGVDPSVVMPFGTRELVAYGMRHGWRVYWDDSYDYTSLLCLGDDFINHDMTVGKLDELKVPDTGKVYLREASGFNILKGRVISGYSFGDCARGFKHASPMDKRYHDWHPITGDSMFVFAPVKNILEEYRVWVIGGRVTSSSRYILNGAISYENSDGNEEVVDFSQRMADKMVFSTDNYVIDVFRTDLGLKVGEINCIHCSGWYDIDSGKVVRALVNGGCDFPPKP